jgi:hypothetical protein
MPDATHPAKAHKGKPGSTVQRFNDSLSALAPNRSFPFFPSCPASAPSECGRLKMAFTADSLGANMTVSNPMDSSVAGTRLDITPKWDAIQVCIITC